jgi:hypothetical protein
MTWRPQTVAASTAASAATGLALAKLFQAEIVKGLNNSFSNLLNKLGLTRPTAMEAQRIGTLPDDELKSVLNAASKEKRLLYFAELIKLARPYWYKASREAKHRKIATAAKQILIVDRPGPFPLSQICGRFLDVRALALFAAMRPAARAVMTGAAGLSRRRPEKLPAAAGAQGRLFRGSGELERDGQDGRRRGWRRDGHGRGRRQCFPSLLGCLRSPWCGGRCFANGMAQVQRFAAAVLTARRYLLALCTRKGLTVLWAMLVSFRPSGGPWQG